MKISKINMKLFTCAIKYYYIGFESHVIMFVANINDMRVSKCCFYVLKRSHILGNH